MFICVSSWQVDKNYMETHFPEVARADQEASHALYFDKFAKPYLLSALRSIISSASQATRHVATRSNSVLPYRLLRLLMDKPEIGDVIVSDILPDLSACLKLQVENLGGVSVDRATSTKQSVPGTWASAKESGTSSGSGKKSGKKSHKVEILQSANLFFSSLSPEQLWQWMESLLSRTITAGASDTTSDSHNVVPPSPKRDRGSGTEREGKEDTSECDAASIESVRTRHVVLDSLPSSPVYPSSPDSLGQHSGSRGAGSGVGVQLSCGSACKLISFLLQTLPLVTFSMTCVNVFMYNVHK